MSLTFTPRQLSQRADLYHQLGQLISAGIGLPQALEIQRRSPPAISFRKPTPEWSAIAWLAAFLNNGFATSAERPAAWNRNA